MSGRSAPVGTPLAPRDVVVRAERMAVLSALLDDPVPIHYDRSAVRRLGLGDRLVNQGPMALGYLAEVVHAWAGPDGSLVRLRCRFLANVFEGDELRCVGAVAEVEGEAETTTVDLEIRRGDEVVVSGAACVRWGPPSSEAGDGSR